MRLAREADGTGPRIGDGSNYPFYFGLVTILSNRHEMFYFWVFSSYFCYQRCYCF